MRPYKVTFHLYAEDQIQVDELQNALYDLVCDSYQENIYITADKLKTIIKGYSPLIKAYFR